MGGYLGGLIKSVALLSCAVMSACLPSRTSYYERADFMQPVEEDEQLPLVSRNVTFGLTRRFYHLAPRCVAVLNAKTETGQAIHQAEARVIADAVSRHLVARFDRVIGPKDVARMKRRQAIADGDHPTFTRRTRCEAVMEIVTPGLEETYALVFAYAKLPLELRLKQGKDGALLWWGRHEVERADGGLPFDLISLPVELITAGLFARDAEDRLRSMADDGARRVLMSLPSLRMSSLKN